MTTSSALATPQPVPKWLMIVYGILAIIVGLLFLLRPVATTATAVLVLGIYWIIIGVIDIIRIFQDSRGWGWKLFTGVIAIIAGGLILSGYIGDTRAPLATTLAVGSALVIVVAILGIIYAIVSLIAAFRGGGWGVGLLGILIGVLSIILLLNPMAATLGLPLVIGIWLIIDGIIKLIAAFVR